MAKKAAKTTSYPAPKGDGLEIPAFLKRTGDEKPAPAAAHSLSAAAATPPSKPFNVPKGMTEEEYNRTKAKLDPAPIGKMKPKAEKKEPKTPKPTPLEGTFTLADLARENKEDPRMYRRMARSNKKAFADLFAQGRKYTFLNEDRAKVLQLVRDAVAGMKKAPAKVVAKKKAAQPTPDVAAPAKDGPAGNAVDVQASADARKEENAKASHEATRLAAAKAKKPKKSKFAKK